VFKCKRCRRTLATSHNLLPHVRGERPQWTDSKWSLPAEEVLEGASDLGLDLCSQSVFISPVRWMQAEVRQSLAGRLYCPNCQGRVGDYSWVAGCECRSCGVVVVPAFQLDVTEIIFRTRNRFLQSSGREPVLV
jgi:dual specificity phosphatase 12